VGGRHNIIQKVGGNTVGGGVRQKQAISGPYKAGYLGMSGRLSWGQLDGVYLSQHNNGFTLPREDWNKSQCPPTTEEQITFSLSRKNESFGNRQKKIRILSKHGNCLKKGWNLTVMAS